VENPDEQTPLAPEPVIEGAGANRMLPVIPILIALLAAGFFFFLFLKRRKEKEEA
jgi:LPXTG-motif cell wall-anchored protein